jgi:probable phosphoglycerate mutase
VSDSSFRVPGNEPVRITFVRHGESVSNRSGRWQGQGDSPLSERGRAQAEAVGQRLKARTFARVISSDLSRAHDTARATGFTLQTSRAWREFDVGNWEGLTREEVLERYPEDMERLKAGEDVPLGGGESYAAFSARIDAALSALLASLDEHERDVLVVCHGGVIATVMARVLGLRGQKRWPLWRAANTSLTELTFRPDGKHELAVFNDTHHLAALGAWPAFEEVTTCLALVSGTPPHADFGAFAAHYDEASRFSGLLELAAESDGAKGVSALLSAVHAKHPSDRVSVALRTELISAWVSETVWLGGAPTAEIVPLEEGALCHVGFVSGKAQLLDYNVRAK